MISQLMRAYVVLFKGCQLRYEPPPSNEHHGDALKFFQTYRGKSASFVGYAEEFVGPLDFKGRAPGRYTDPKFIVVQFDGEETTKTIHAENFVITDGKLARITFVKPGDRNRIGDLLNPVAFYPGDIVRVIGKPGVAEGPRQIGDVFLEEPFTQDGVPRYSALETEAEKIAREKLSARKTSALSFSQRASVQNFWNVLGDELELVSRGNVWALYNDPTKLSFDSDKDELTFWTHPGISAFSGNDETDVHVVREAIQEGKTDTFSISPIKPHLLDHDLYLFRNLHKCFKEHRPRVQALSLRMMKQTA